MKARIIFIVLIVWMSNSYSQDTVIGLSKSTENRFDITQVSPNIDTLEVNVKLAPRWA